MSCEPPTHSEPGQLPALAPVATGLYRHYKGGWYEVLGTCRCSETLQAMVVYRACPGGPTQPNPTGGEWDRTWVRPAALFGARVEVGDSNRPRFEAVDPATWPMVPLANARALMAHWQRLASRSGQALRAPPPEPTSCCGRGCNGCVWEGYYQAAELWRADAVLACGGSSG